MINKAQHAECLREEEPFTDVHVESTKEQDKSFLVQFECAAGNPKHTSKPPLILLSHETAASLSWSSLHLLKGMFSASVRALSYSRNSPSGLCKTGQMRSVCSRYAFCKPSIHQQERELVPGPCLVFLQHLSLSLLFLQRFLMLVQLVTAGQHLLCICASVTAIVQVLHPHGQMVLAWCGYRFPGTLTKYTKTRLQQSVAICCVLPVEDAASSSQAMEIDPCDCGDAGFNPLLALQDTWFGVSLLRCSKSMSARIGTILFIYLLLGEARRRASHVQQPWRVSGAAGGI